MALTAMAIAAGLGLLKSEAIDKPKEEKQRQLRAKEIQLSPWSHLEPSTQIQTADPFGTALQFGATGAMMGRGMSQDKAAQALMDKQAAGNTWSGLGGEAAPADPNYLGVDTSQMNAFPAQQNKFKNWIGG